MRPLVYRMTVAHPAALDIGRLPDDDRLGLASVREGSNVQSYTRCV
jgi:hypothetical protein